MQNLHISFLIWLYMEAFLFIVHRNPFAFPLSYYVRLLWNAKLWDT